MKGIYKVFVLLLMLGARNAVAVSDTANVVSKTGEEVVKNVEGSEICNCLSRQASILCEKIKTLFESGRSLLSKKSLSKGYRAAVEHAQQILEYAQEHKKETAAVVLAAAAVTVLTYKLIACLKNRDKCKSCTCTS